MLKAISNRIIPGLPDNLRILLVSQVDDEDDGNDKDDAFVLPGDDEETRSNPEFTVTERVVKSERRRERAILEQQGLPMRIL